MCHSFLVDKRRFDEMILMLINSSDSFSRFLALYKFVCMYDVDDDDDDDDDMGLTDEGLCYSVQSGLWQAGCRSNRTPTDMAVSVSIL